MRFTLLIALLLAACCGHAADADTPSDESGAIHFRVEIDAPRHYRQLLEEGLDLVRWQRAERVTMPLLERLVAEAQKETTEALAADGYFSAQVSTRIERRP